MNKLELINLNDLASACDLYSKITKYDKSYLEFLASINFSLDILKSKNRDALIIWLRKWQCRQFELEYHNVASENIFNWFKKFKNYFPDRNIGILDINVNDLDFYSQIYDNLSNSKASWKCIGPTGASKILFAVRPNIFIPWDDSIRTELKFKDSGFSYINYLKNIKIIIEDLKVQCVSKGFTIEDLPKIINRLFSSLTKLIDEFYWVTIINK